MQRESCTCKADSNEARLEKTGDTGELGEGKELNIEIRKIIEDLWLRQR